MAVHYLPTLHCLSVCKDPRALAGYGCAHGSSAGGYARSSTGNVDSTTARCSSNSTENDGGVGGVAEEVPEATAAEATSLTRV